MIKRLKLAWHILTGKPAIYGNTFENNVSLKDAKSVIITNNKVV